MGRVASRRLSKGGTVAALTLALAVSAMASGAQAQRGGLGRGGAPGIGGGARFAPSFGGQAPGLGYPSSSADGGPPTSLKDFLFGSHGGERRGLPAVARYRVDDGDGFVLDRGSGATLLKFEDSPEVWVLTPMAGPRGDTIFKNDVGDPVLRMTRLGGMTLFTDARPDGMPVSMVGAAASVRPVMTIGPNALFQAMAQSSLRVSRAAQHLIPFVLVPDATPKTDWLFADAAVVAAEAFVRLCGQGDGRAIATHLSRVEFLAGGSSQAALQGSVFQITIAPAKGVAGRPSSKQIFLVLHRR